MEVYNEFVRKRAAVLFATDIAARGLGKSLAENILGPWVIEFAYKWMDLGIHSFTQRIGPSSFRKTSKLN